MDSNFDKLINSASKKLGTSPEKLRETLAAEDLKALSARLSKQDKARLREILADKELMERLKSATTPEELLGMIGKK